MKSFFIAGEQRSGTTLLSVLLSKHSQVYIDGLSVGFRLINCFENYAFALPFNAEKKPDELGAWLIENDYKGRLAGLLDYKNLHQYSSAQTVIQEGIDRRLAENGKKLYGDKSPGIHHYMPSLKALIPEAKIIHVVRDARAVAQSQFKRTGKNLRVSAQDWVDGNAKGLTNQMWFGKDSYLILRYEDLIMEPERTLKQVCDFLEIKFEELMIEEGESAYEKDNYVLPKFEKSKIDNYLSELTDKQVYRIERITAPLLRRFGYKLTTNAERIPHKRLPIITRVWLNQIENVKRLFISKRKGMINRKLVDVHVPLKVRLKHFAFEWSRDFLSDRVFTRVFLKKRIRQIYMDK